jgi:hypothetical protein
VVVLQVEAMKHVDHLTRLRDGLADIVEIVKESLQLGTRNSDGHITLVEIAEFRLVEDGALELIVVEEVGDGCLDRERVHLTTTNGHSSKQGGPTTAVGIIWPVTTVVVRLDHRATRQYNVHNSDGLL